MHIFAAMLSIAGTAFVCLIVSAGAYAQSPCSTPGTCTCAQMSA